MNEEVLKKIDETFKQLKEKYVFEHDIQKEAEQIRSSMEENYGKQFPGCKVNLDSIDDNDILNYTISIPTKGTECIPTKL